MVFLGNNISNINIASGIANGAMPGSTIGSSVIGNGLNFSLSGWQGVSASNSGTMTLMNMFLGLGGNKIGDGLGKLSRNFLQSNEFQSHFIGNLFGDYIGYGSQTINEFGNQ